MSEKFLDKLAARLSKSPEDSGSSNFQFAELSEVEWDKISAAFVSNHASIHYSSP